MLESAIKAVTEAFEREGRVLDEGQAEILVRATVEAIREPTPEMRMRGSIAWLQANPDSETYVDASDACWKAMIDVAIGPRSDN